nr:2-amino-4-hydroxy-6-hydroxymethyldihydropteridine diphosphokinase [Treponema sp.]
YVTNQNDFYNMVICGKTELDAPSLLAEIHRVEASLGRNRDKEIRFGPRSIDIDIELFGNQVINYPDLEVPHIRMYERAFVLVPFIELYDSMEETSKAVFESAYKKARESIKSIDCQDIKRI